MTLYLSSHPEIKRTGYNLGKRCNRERSGHFGWAPESWAPERSTPSAALQDCIAEPRGRAEERSQIETDLNMASLRRNMAEFSSLGCFSVELRYLEFPYRFSPISNSHLGNSLSMILAQVGFRRLVSIRVSLLCTHALVYFHLLLWGSNSCLQLLLIHFLLFSPLSAFTWRVFTTTPSLRPSVKWCRNSFLSFLLWRTC